MRKLEIVIDFRVEDLRQGLGMSSLALAHGLSRLRDQDQEYVFLVYEHAVEWLQPHVSGPCSVAVAPSPPTEKAPSFRRSLRRLAFLRNLWVHLRPGHSLVPASDGLLERLGCDVVHFPSQIACRTEVPSIYQPWDLQHRHHPEFFPPADRYLRDMRYRALCRQARFVCVQTEWGKQDLLTQYALDPAKVAVIRWGAPSEAYPAATEAEAGRVREELQLPTEFFLYPAITWPHKNHELILRALHQLKAAGRRTHVVFTGASTPYRSKLEALAKTLDVQKEVRWLGFVSSHQLQCLYRMATAMIFPSKFEGLGLPILEALRADLPVLCSSATVLPEVAGDAAIFFDPGAPSQLAAAIEKVRLPEVRARLLASGRQMMERYSMDRAALEFAALYRRAAEKA